MNRYIIILIPILISIMIGIGHVSAQSLCTTGPVINCTDFPSTNHLNTNQLTPRRPGQLAPHVEVVSVGEGEIVLNFINPRTWAACFEYRIDGIIQTAPPNSTHAANMYGFIPNNEALYTDAFCLNNDTSQRTFTVNGFIEVRHTLGGESDYWFDWARFDAPSSDGNVGCGLNSIGRVRVTQSAYGYSKPASELIRTENGSPLDVFNDVDNDGIDTFILLDVIQTNGKTWYGIFIGICTPVYIQAENAERIQ